MRIPLTIAAVVALLLGVALAGAAALRPVDGSAGQVRPITVEAPRSPAPVPVTPEPGVVAPPPPLEVDDDDDDGDLDDDGPDDGDADDDDD